MHFKFVKNVMFSVFRSITSGANNCNSLEYISKLFETMNENGEFIDFILS